MGVPFTRLTARDVRAAIAAALTSDDRGASVLGRVSLHSHQRHAVMRIEAAFREFGGALLADATGLGKTYVALAVARTAQSPLVVAPAALRPMWTAAMAATGRSIPIVSLESLGRRRTRRDASSQTPDLVIVDEAHHARNPATARYRALAALTERAKVLLLTATPVHNNERDLVALLSLFLGARAGALQLGAAMRCVIRRTAAGSGPQVPVVEPPRTLIIPDDEERMHAIVALPPPVPPSDGRDGGVLLVYSLLRRWASSQGALAESLRRRLARASALLGALDAGRYPSSSELAAWSYADGAMQLAFAELMVDGAVETTPAAALIAAIHAHSSAVRSLLDDLRRTRNVDEHRAAHLRTIRAANPGAKIVAFTQYAETVIALHNQLRREPRIAALTSTGARIAGGTLSRTEALARFAPHGQRQRAVGPAERIDLLLTTDLLSEGVNLQDASIVVHLDLPWTPARLEQRVGRAARIGSRHERVMVYTMQPPASAERLVRVEERLRAKLGAGARAVGVVGTILPGLSLQQGRPLGVSPSEWRERIAAAALPWTPGGVDGTPEADDRCDLGIGFVAAAEMPIVAAVHAAESGLLALVRDDGDCLVASLDGVEVTDDPDIILRAIDGADGSDAAVDDAMLDEAVRALEHWRASRADRRDITLDGALRARARRTVVDRIASIARRAPRHLRPAIAELAATARRTATARYGAGAERVLDELAAATMPDEAWLRAITTFGALHASGAAVSPGYDRKPWIIAVMLLVAPRTPET